jgi:hypothetical protein
MRKFVTMHGNMNVTMHGHMNVTMHDHMNIKNIHVVYTHTRLSANGVLEGSIKKGDM